MFGDNFLMILVVLWTCSMWECRMLVVSTPNLHRLWVLVHLWLQGTLEGQIWLASCSMW